MEEQNIRDYCDSLTTLGIENTALEHPASKEIAGVLNFLGLSFSDCVPTLIMKADHRFIAAVIRGDTRVDFKKIKKAFGIKDLRMATPEEFTDLTGLPLGTARVYTPGIQTIMDTKVFEKEYLTGGSGRFDCSIRVKTSDLIKVPDSVVADINK